MDNQDNLINPQEAVISSAFSPPVTPITPDPVVETPPITPIIPDPVAQPQVVNNVSSNNDFSTSEAISFGWNMAKKHFLSYLIISVPVLIPMVLMIIATMTFGEEPEVGAPGYFIVNLVSLVTSLTELFVMSSIIVLSLMIVDNKITEGQKISMFIGKDTIISMFIAFLVYFVKVGLWSLLLIIPGYYISYKHIFTIFVAVDSRTYKGAYKNSGELTKGVLMKIFWLFFLVSLINMLGMMALGLGLILTLPTAYLAVTYVYRKLAGNSFTVEATPVVNPADAGMTPISPTI